MTFVCTWCQGGAHSHCFGATCDCEHKLESGYFSPTRREQLRNGAKPFTARETEFQIAYAAHREARYAADDRRS